MFISNQSLWLDSKPPQHQGKLLQIQEKLQWRHGNLYNKRRGIIKLGSSKANLDSSSLSLSDKERNRKKERKKKKIIITHQRSQGSSCSQWTPKRLQLQARVEMRNRLRDSPHFPLEEKKKCIVREQPHLQILQVS